MREHPLSKLARSKKYQQLYIEYREGRLRLFENETDFTPTQLEFLEWCQVHYIIRQDIINKEIYAFKDLQNDPMRVKAYLIIKSKIIEERIKREKSKKGR